MSNRITTDETTSVRPAFAKQLLAVRAGCLIDVYGVEMTSLQNMLFSKYIANNGIAMNTKTKEQRKEIAEYWLENNCSG